MTGPRVSVLLLTRDSEQVVERALASIRSQVLDEAVDVVVGDDASSDRTLSIITAWADREDVPVRVLRSEERLGAGAALHRGITACRGRYVAVLRADDEWTAPDKLRRQIELLDRHPELSMAATRTLVVQEGAGASETVPPLGNAAPDHHVELLVDGTGLPTPSC